MGGTVPPCRPRENLHRAPTFAALSTARMEAIYTIRNTNIIRLNRRCQVVTTVETNILRSDRKTVIDGREAYPGRPWAMSNSALTMERTNC